MKRRAAIYVTSSHSDADRVDQEEALRAFAADAGFEVRHVLRAEPAMACARQKAMTLAREGQIDAILIASLTCWGEAAGALHGSLVRLRRWGVSLIARRGFSVDVETERGQIAIDLLSEIVELEHAVRGARVRTGIVAARKEADAERVAALVRVSMRAAAEIYTASKSGASYRAMAERLGVSKNTVMKLVELGRNSGGLRRTDWDNPSGDAPPPDPTKNPASCRAAAAELGVSPDTVVKLLALVAALPSRRYVATVSMADWPMRDSLKAGVTTGDAAAVKKKI